MIPVNQPVVGQREKDYVAECLETGWVSSAGRFIAAFEQEWAGYCGRRYGVAVTNGTAALEAAVAVLDLAPGDEVIVPSFTIISCVGAVLRAGAKPVLVDAHPGTWTLDPEKLEACVSPKTKAIMPVHIYGHPADMDGIAAIAEKHRLVIIEDAAEAHGAAYQVGKTAAGDWKKCGGFGLMSTFSFYANKLISTGEGGMILTDDPICAERLSSLRNLCFQSAPRFVHHDLGFNFRMTNMQAALGLGQVERFDEIVARKRAVGMAYRERLAKIGGLKLQANEPWARCVYWMNGVMVEPETGFDAVTLAEKLRELGVDTRPFFVGMHRQPVFKKQGLFIDQSFPVTDQLSRQGLYLPSGLALTDEQLEQVCLAVEKALQ